MSSKRFLSLSLLSIGGLLASVVGFNMYIDIYGLFRPAQGRVLLVSGEERVAKYLQSFRYIPDNFNGVLLGSSVSDNLDTHGLSNFSVYNASINGGNVEDVKALAENIFRRTTFELTIICMHRSLTNDHAFRTGLMTSRQYWGALGSPQLMTAYLSRVASRFGATSYGYDGRGTLHFGTAADLRGVQQRIDAAVVGIQNGTTRVGNYHVDPVAFHDLQGVIGLARSHSRRLVVFYPPMPESILAVSSKGLSRYRDAMNTLLDSDTVMLDFNLPEYKQFRENPNNFIDAVHLSQQGAGFVISELQKAVDTRFEQQISKRK